MATISTPASTVGDVAGNGGNTQNFEVPVEILDPWLGKINDASIVASLSQSIPMKFGTGQAFSFDTDEAEHVGEGANKSSSTYSKTSWTTAPQKFQKTMRFTDEVLWADEDHQLQIVSDLLAMIQPALSRALDYGIIHGINPKTGDAVAAMGTNLNASITQSVEVNYLDPNKKPFNYIDDADALVLANGFVPGDVALDPSLAAKFSAYRNPQTEQKVYPNFRLGAEVSELEGHRAATSRTVQALGVATTPSNLLGLVGDFSTIRWGVQRSIGLKLIEYGDPDGGGDLQRNNQVAFRAEVVYGWGFADLDALVKIANATPDVAPV